MSTTAERYAELEARIQKSDTDALLARLAFGLDLLAERGDAGRLPNGRIEELLHACNSRSTLDAFRLEVWRRMHFAERYPTEELALAALDTFGSWHRICDHGFGVAEPEAENGRRALTTPIARTAPAELIELGRRRARDGARSAGLAAGQRRGRERVRAAGAAAAP